MRGTTRAPHTLDVAAIRTAPLRIAGIDEAGRGPLAGPVAVAAVVFAPGRVPVNGLDDSKALDADRREVLCARIQERALAWHVVLIEVDEIDRVNILQATFTGMRRVLDAVAHACDAFRVDGNIVPRGMCRPGEAWIGGDARDRAIMAASILAKVTRDAHMRSLHDAHPEYGFDAHKGYSTPQHLAALHAHGPCPHHRRSFGPVRAACPVLRAQDAERAAREREAACAQWPLALAPA